MTESITARVVQLAAGVLGVPAGSMTAASTASEIDAWDSLAQLSLLVSIEDEFGLTIDPGDVADLPDLGMLAKHVADRLDA